MSFSSGVMTISDQKEFLYQPLFWGLSCFLYK
jgi:hypothetical protein